MLYRMNFIKNITYGLLGGTFGVTGMGMMTANPAFAIASLVFGGAAIFFAITTKNQIRMKELDKKLAIEMV